MLIYDWQSMKVESKYLQVVGIGAPKNWNRTSYDVISCEISMNRSLKSWNDLNEKWAKYVATSCGGLGCNLVKLWDNLNRRIFTVLSPRGKLCQPERTGWSLCRNKLEWNTKMQDKTKADRYLPRAGCSNPFSGADLDCVWLGYSESVKRNRYN